MSFVICNSQPDQNAVNFTTYFRNEVVVPANAKIGVYTCQINITPEIEINENNNEFAFMWDYQFQGEDPDPANDAYPKLNVKRYLPNTIKLPNKLYSVDDLATEIFYQLTWGDKSGLNQFVVEPIRDSSEKFIGYKITVNQIDQPNFSDVATDMTNMVVKKLHDGDDEQTITHPTANTIKIEKTSGVNGVYDCIYQLGGAIYRDGSDITFTPHIYTNSHYFGLSRNISFNDGEAITYLDFQAFFPLETVNAGRKLQLDATGGFFKDVGAFCDYSVFIHNSQLRLFSCKQLGEKTQMRELQYWTTGLPGVDEIITLTSNDPVIKFTINNEKVEVHYKVAGGDFVTINRGTDWKGISSTTMVMYPLVAMDTETDYNVIDSSQSGTGVCFLKPRGDANSFSQAIKNTTEAPLNEFISDNYIKLIDFGWDYCVHDVNTLYYYVPAKVVEQNVQLALEARERKANAGSWDDVTGYMGITKIENSEFYFTAGAKAYTSVDKFYPYLLTSKIVQTVNSEVMVDWVSNTTIATILNMQNIIMRTQWNGAYAAFSVSSIDTPKNINSSNAYVRINNLPIQTYNGTNNSISRIIGIVPRFNAHRSIGHIYTIHNPPVYIKLNNVEPLVVSQLSLSLVNDDEILCSDISGNTQIMFHIIDT
tara:strand:+ start:568 stop:2517 length:1950 start_codon:yes stop_codon:yes gene_type:complete